MTEDIVQSMSLNKILVAILEEHGTLSVPTTRFVNAVIKGDLENVKDPQKLKKKFEDIVDDLAKEYSKEISAEEKLYKDFKKSSEFKDFSEGLDEKLYPKGKTRKFTYTTVPGTDAETQKTAISQLYSGGNTGEDSTSIGKAKFNS